MPLLLLGILSTLGLLLSFKKNANFKFLIVYYFFNVAIISMFFILPRYKMAILPLQIILTGSLIENIKLIFDRKNLKL